MLAVITASTAKTVVPVRPNAPRQAVASSGPSTKPPLPPMENRLMPVPLFCPDTALAKRAPSGWNRAAPMPLRPIAANIPQ